MRARGEMTVGKIREGRKNPLPVLFNTDRLEFEPRGNGESDDHR